jgi:hypothetical protein
MPAILLLLLLFPTALDAEVNPLDTLRPKHPRIIAGDYDFARTKALVKVEPLAKQLHERLVSQAQRILEEPPIQFELIGPRLLDKSRRALDRIYTLAFLYRLTEDKRYRDRAVQEMRAAADFPNWNPSHFLDTAEMTHAFAIGYDWLYDSLSADERKWIREAIVEKGLKQAIPIYEQQRWWVIAHHNWNQVCNGGIGIGALAVAEDEPALSRRILDYAKASMPRAMASYGPDGGWNEGPGYWHYATRYTVYFLAALNTALGTDFGLSNAQGFDRAGHFRIYFTSPTGETFNYADSGSRAGSAPELFWMARRFAQPAYAWQQREELKHSKRADPLDLVWYALTPIQPDQEKWPLDAVFEGVQVAFLRSSWTDPNAIFVAVKGGDNKANHSHLDLGSFVMDAHGTRWALDFGGDDYNLPAYFGKQRWTYYRLKTESHNTVLIDDENQNESAKAPIIARSFKPDLAQVRFDLKAAYPSKLARHEREVRMINRKQVVFADDIEAAQAIQPLWGMITDAAVKLDGRRATLTKDGRMMRAEVLSPADAAFDIVSTQPPPPQMQNSGTRKLVVRLSNPVTKTRIEVRFTPE